MSLEHISALAWRCACWNAHGLLSVKHRNKIPFIILLGSASVEKIDVIEFKDELGVFVSQVHMVVTCIKWCMMIILPILSCRSISA